MAKVNPDDFLLNTDFEMDQIILAKTGDFIGTVEIPHSLQYAPLPFGIWSTDENFSTVNSIGVSDPGSYPGYTKRLGVDCVSFSDKILLKASGDGSNTTKIYYRLFAFEPDNIRKTAPHTANFANQFILNTDYNYRKILATGVFTQSGQEYEHNLGYIPQIMAWGDYTEFGSGHGIEPILYASNYTNAKITVTPTKIKVGDLLTNEKTYWRIYHDKA